MTPETVVSELKDLRGRVEKLESANPTAAQPAATTPATDVTTLSTRVDGLEANLNSLRDVVGVPEHGTLTDAENAVNAVAEKTQT